MNGIGPLRSTRQQETDMCWFNSVAIMPKTARTYNDEHTIVVYNFSFRIFDINDNELPVCNNTDYRC